MLLKQYRESTKKQFSNIALKIQPCQIQKWRKEENQLREQKKYFPKAGSLRKGRALNNKEQEQKVFAQKRSPGLAVSTNTIVEKALYLDAGFKNVNAKILLHWLYLYLSRRYLDCRMATRTNQKLNGHLLEVWLSFFQKLMQNFNAAEVFQDVPPCMFENRHETTVIFEAKKPNISF